jgi:hypothetical protein
LCTRYHSRSAEILDDYPAVPDSPARLEKYGEAIDARFGSAEKFAQRFSVPVRVRVREAGTRESSRSARSKAKTGDSSRRAAEA